MKKKSAPFSGPKGRDSIAQGAALGRDLARQAQPQRGETPAKSPSSDAPLGLANVRCAATQGCALGYRVWPRWGKGVKQNTPVFGLCNTPVVGLFNTPVFGDFLLKPTELFSIKPRADRKMGTERMGNLRSSESANKGNGSCLFLSPFFCQPFEASQWHCRHEREVSVFDLFNTPVVGLSEVQP